MDRFDSLRPPSPDGPGRPRPLGWSRLAGLAPWLLLGTLVLGCKDGDRGPRGPATTTTEDTELEPGQASPGMQVAITALGGASGPGGAFQPGDRLRVTFTARKTSGAPWVLTELGSSSILVSGPTFNYQRVIAPQEDVHTAALRNADGSYTYTFPMPLPASYLPPIHDSASFDATDGELTGQALLSGTYTVGLALAFEFTEEGVPFQDVDNATMDFLVGSATTIQPRDLVRTDNCNQCHASLRACDPRYREVKLCLACHTSGAEDLNDPMVAGGTPANSLDSRVFFHRLHNGAHLPSVLGIGTFPGGARNYGQAPAPYLVVDGGGGVHDFSGVEFPVWPSLSFPMPRDAGHAGLTAGEQAQEDGQRGGVVACHVCHGDPDGAGPLTAPTQEEVIWKQPTRRACGSCHDDVDWDEWYTSNGVPMPPQPDDSACILCHGVSGHPFAVQDAHRHPLLEPTENPGLNFELLSVVEAGTHDGDNTLDPGEKVALTFTVKDDLGFDVDPADLATLVAVLSGPTTNPNLVLNARIPTGALTGAQPYTVPLPQAVDLEYLGDATAGPDVFMTALAPHWTAAGAPTTVWERTATGAGSTLASASSAPQNYLDVTSGAAFARNDFVVVDDGTGAEEYLLVQWVEGNRLWFASPQQTGAEPGAPAAYKAGTSFDHLAGASVDVVTLTEAVEGVGNDYVLTAASGTLTLTPGAFGPGNAVVVSYSADFVMPARYPLALNDAPEIDETWGEWAGKTLVDGTYRLALWSTRTLDVTRGGGEATSYRAAALPAVAEVLAGNAALLEPYDRIASESCTACHQDLYFHGGNYRGLDACLQCHGSAGAEDRPRYRAPNAPATAGESVEFRRMLHRIHHGEALSQAATYTVVGFGPGGDHPDNYSAHTYEEVAFPAMPAGAQQCDRCHAGGGDSWTEPTRGTHPSEQGLGARPWRTACASCHDSASAAAHIDDQTLPGSFETCAVCHGPGAALEVEAIHAPRF